ncbi:MAG: response regulator [Rivularia sp. (in: Bacteria)]|nr:response regulator [Rivularia sp. MS3]
MSSNSKSLTKQPSLKTLETARILIVDNSPDNVSLVKTILEEEGYQVSTAENGIAGLSLIEDNSPDLIILEILMPEIDGYEITRRIRKNTKLPFIPILLITAHDSPNVAHGLDLGANDFIRKPVTVDELLARVRSLLRIKEMVRKAQSNI